MVWRVWFLVWLFKDLVIGWGNGLNSSANHCTTPISQDGHDLSKSLYYTHQPRWT